MNADRVCTNCRNDKMDVFFVQHSVPVNSCILLPTKEEALAYPRGDIELGHCPSCGFISNTAFDPSLIEYSSRYEETQGFSPTFNKFHDALARRMVDRYDLHGKHVLEIGCGKGEFLNMVCKMGNNRGTGFDPGYMDDRKESEPVENVEFIKDFYSEKYSDHQGDFVCCKMTLEHIPETADFIEKVGHSVSVDRETVVFFQVPHSTRILKECAFEDIYYEHCSYFYEGPLAKLFHDFGLEILRVESEYDEQYLTIEAKAVAKGHQKPLAQDKNLGVIQEYVNSFTDRYKRKVSEWQKLVDDRSAKGEKVVIWGSGSKGVSFLSSINGNDRIEYAVDINPYRQGHFMSGFGQEIVDPGFLKDYKPDLVIVMNGIYKDEIGQTLTELGLSPEVVAL